MMAMLQIVITDKIFIMKRDFTWLLLAVLMGIIISLRAPKYYEPLQKTNFSAPAIILENGIIDIAHIQRLKRIDPTIKL